MSQSGVSFREIFWTIGPYDLVGIVEGPDDATVTAALLSVAGKETSGRRACVPSMPTRCAA